MAVISTLAVSLRANTRRFTRSMTRATRVVTRVARSFTKLTKVIAPLTLALGGLSGLSFTAIFQDTRKWADQVGKLSDELGLAVDKLLGLRLAAELTGTTVDVLTKGLQRMNRRIGEANAGYGEAVKGLADLGLEAKDLAGLSAFEQFKRIADATAQMGNQADKAAAVYTLFGRQGAMLLNLFALQGKGIDEVTKKLTRLMGTVTTFDIDQIENMNDEIVFLQTALKGFSLRTLIQLAPTIAALMNALTDGLVALRKNHVPDLVRGVERGVDRILTMVQQVAPVVVIAAQSMRMAFKNAIGFVVSLVDSAKTGLEFFFNTFIKGSALIRFTDEVFAGFGANNAFEKLSVGATVFLSAIGSIREQISIMGEELFLSAFTLKRGFKEGRVLEFAQEFWKAMIETARVSAQLIGDLLDAAFEPGDFSSNVADAFKVWNKETDDAVIKVRQMWAEMDAPVAPFRAELQQRREAILKRIEQDVEGNLTSLRSILAEIDEAIAGIRDFELSLQLPQIEMNGEDRELLKKAFAPAALRGSQQAEKILAESRFVPEIKIPAINIQPIADAIKTELTELTTMMDPSKVIEQEQAVTDVFSSAVGSFKSSVESIMRMGAPDMPIKPPAPPAPVPFEFKRVPLNTQDIQMDSAAFRALDETAEGVAMSLREFAAGARSVLGISEDRDRDLPEKLLAAQARLLDRADLLPGERLFQDFGKPFLQAFGEHVAADPARAVQELDKPVTEEMERAARASRNSKLEKANDATIEQTQILRRIFEEVAREPEQPINLGVLNF